MSKFDRVYHRGLKFLARSRPEKALECLEIATALKPKDPRVYMQYGSALSESGRYHESVAALQKAISLDPNNAIFPLYLGVIHIDQGNLELAKSELEHSLKMDGNNLLTQNFLALSRWAMGHQEEGMAGLLKIGFVQSSAFEARLLALIEECFEKAGIRETRLFEDPEPSNGKSFFVFSWLKRRQRSYKKWRARRLKEKAQKLSIQAKYEGELAFLEKAIDLWPENNGLKESLLHARKRKIKACQKALRKKQGDSELLYQLGELYLEVGDLDAARSSLKEWCACEMDRKEKAIKSCRFFSALRMLYEIEMSKNNSREALEHIKELCLLNPYDTYLQYYLGRCLIAQKDRHGARRAFQKFLNKEPGFARLRLRTLMELKGETKEKH